MGFRKIVVVVFLQVWSVNTCLSLHSSVIKKKLSSKKFNVIQNDKIEADVKVENIVQALEKITFYYSKHKHEATVDFAFGMRVAEGEIARVLHMSEINAYPDVKKSPVYRKLKSLLRNMRITLKQSLPFIKANDKKYFDQFYSIIKESWSSFQLAPQMTKPTDESVFSLNAFDDGVFTEEKSDVCMSSLMGSKEYETCSVDVCWDMMTNMRSSLYYTTHQILWFLLGHKIGCEKRMNEKAKESGYLGGFEDILKRKCSSVVVEMEAITEDGVRKGMIDIFLEQGFICGGIGFMDAVRPQWLKLSLSWQDPTLGCVQDYYLDSDEEEDKNEFQFWINYKREQWKSRNLLVESVLNDGCTTHTTAVAAGFLATYLRLFFDPIYKKHQLDPFVKDEFANVEKDFSDVTWEIISNIAVMFLIFGFILLILKKRSFLRTGFGVFNRCLVLQRKSALTVSPLSLTH